MGIGTKIPFRLTLLFLVIVFIGVACNSPETTNKVYPTVTNTTHLPLAGATKIPSARNSPLPPTPTISAVPTQTSSLLPTRISTETSTARPSSTPTETAFPSSTPTYAILRGTVLEQSNCRYGPGAAYLYKYGLFPGFNIEIIGRNEPGTWVVIQAIGGSNPCWVKASLIDIHGEVMSLAPASLPLPQSPYYGPLTGVSAMRHDDKVIISWNTLELRAGDDSLQFPYLVEAWLCQDGQLTFAPIGSWNTILTVRDEPGCIQPSHARVYGVEKHGYTAWVNIPWPQPQPEDNLLSENHRVYLRK